MSHMTTDIHKLTKWLEKVCKEGISQEGKLLEWKVAEERKAVDFPQSRAS